MPRKPNHYLSNATLLAELERSHRIGKPTDALARAFMLLVDRMATRPNFFRYSHIDDMKGAALLTLMKVWDRFDVGKSQNPFAYFSQTVWNQFVSEITREQDARDVQHEIEFVRGLDVPETWFDRVANREAKAIKNHEKERARKSARVAKYQDVGQGKDVDRRGDRGMGSAAHDA